MFYRAVKNFTRSACNSAHLFWSQGKTSQMAPCRQPMISGLLCCLIFCSVLSLHSLRVVTLFRFGISYVFDQQNKNSCLPLLRRSIALIMQLMEMSKQSDHNVVAASL